LENTNTKTGIRRNNCGLHDFIVGYSKSNQVIKACLGYVKNAFYHNVMVHARSTWLCSLYQSTI